MNASVISRRQCLALGAGLGASLLAAPVRAGTRAPDVVVELFSSQSCNACPPGDQLLGELCNEPGVLALTFHIDYWDYLGWKDTLASPDFSQRQYDYAKARGDNDVYTPQVIVNGAKQMVGSQRSEVMGVVDASRQDRWPVSVAISDGGNEIAIEVGAAASPGAHGTLWAMAILDHVSAKIEKGELAGREITYVNVVRRLVPAAMWDGRANRIVLPKDGLLTPDSTGCVALLQSGKVGPVLGCAGWGRMTS